MDFFDHPYFSLDKKIMSLIGRWPYQKQWESRFYSFILVFVFTSQFIAEILGVIHYWNDKVIILELITPFIVDVAMAMKYVVELLERLKNNWAIYKNTEEASILNEYAHIGKSIVHGYISAIYTGCFIYLFEPVLPNLLNFVLQWNETIPSKYPVPIYWYFMDIEDYFYPLVGYEIICITAIITITAANDSMFIILLQHGCSLFTIAGHQLKNLPKTVELEKNRIYSEKSNDINDIQYNYYVMCIKSHKHAIEFANLLEELYVWSFGVIIALNMPIMSVTAIQIVTQTDTIRTKVRYSMFACCQVMHLFFDCYLSQRLTDCSTAIQEHITYSNWYGLPVKTQKLVSLVTLRSQTPCRLTAGKLMILSMETFSAIVKTSVSYFTVMLSMQ